MASHLVQITACWGFTRGERSEEDAKAAALAVLLEQHPTLADSVEMLEFEVETPGEPRETREFGVIGSDRTFALSEGDEDSGAALLVDTVVAEYGLTVGFDREAELPSGKGRLVGVRGPLTDADRAAWPDMLLRLWDELGEGDLDLLAAMHGAIIDDREDNNIEVAYYLTETSYENLWADAVRLG